MPLESYYKTTTDVAPDKDDRREFRPEKLRSLHPLERQLNSPCAAEKSVALAIYCVAHTHRTHAVMP